MSSEYHVVSPETLKEYIDMLANKKGVKAFVVSFGKDGAAHAPSKKVHLYRIPACVHESIFASNNLAMVLSNSMLLCTVDNLENLSKDAIKAIQFTDEEKKRMESGGDANP